MKFAAMSSKQTRLPDYVPDTISDKQIHDFLHLYYDVSNDGQAHDDYADFFTKDGEFIFNDKKAKGRSGMLSLSYEAFAPFSRRERCHITEPN